MAKVDLQIEVTMVMNLAEAKIVRESLFKSGVRGSSSIYYTVNAALEAK